MAFRSAIRTLPRTGLLRAPCARSLSTAAATSDAFRLDGKVIVVCGAGNPPEESLGVGGMTALLAAERGATVIAVSRSANCLHLMDHFDKAGVRGDSIAVQADCSETEGCYTVREAVLSKYGVVHAVVNAGVHDALPMGFQPGLMGGKGRDRWMRAIQTNLHTQYGLIEAFLPAMIDSEAAGQFLYYDTIASSFGLGQGSQRHAYCAGKAAAAVLTRRLGVEYAQEGIRGNVLKIGFTEGPIVERAVGQAISKGKDVSLDAVNSRRDKFVPRQKQTTPLEISRTGVFLLSDAASAINAAEIFADGGTHSCVAGP